MKAVAYTRMALKDLKALPKADAEAIRKKMVSFASGEPQDVTKLKGLDLYRLRHGDWRLAGGPYGDRNGNHRRPRRAPARGL